MRPPNPKIRPDIQNIQRIPRYPDIEQRKKDLRVSFPEHDEIRKKKIDYASIFNPLLQAKP